MANNAQFGKAEKLKSRKLVEELFARGKSVHLFPIRISYKFLAAQADEKVTMQAGVSVSKRNFKRAVDRNRIKRLLREAYRLQKQELIRLLKDQHKIGYVFFIYTDKQMPQYRIIFDAMTKCLDVLIRKATADETPS